jgi:phosphohistidine phosphatase
MKRLTLLRHAKSGDDGTVPRDFDRPLNAKGRRAARTVGRHIRDAGLRFDAVLASPAVRVMETIDAVSDGIGRDLAPTWEKRIYLASPDELLDVVQGAPAEADSLLLVGHNPGLEQLVLLLVPDAGEDGDGARGDVAAKYPTASIAELTVDVARWDQVAPGSAELVRFVRPRDLDPELGPEYA